MRQGYEFVHDEDGANVKMILMMNVIRIHMIAIHLADREKIRTRDDKDLSARERKYAAKSRLDPTEWFAYMTFSSTCLMGPPIEYNDFLEFINMRGQYGRMDQTAALLPAYKRFY
jgi:D-alanyl-lipoteichoic acid acyltransferase DltB (MBOAT superfamily)